MSSDTPKKAESLADFREWTQEQLANFARDSDIQCNYQQARIDELEVVVKAVAHIGIDWGFGKHELQAWMIDKARELYEASTHKGGEG